MRRKGERKFEGPTPPSIEWQLHATAYEVRPDCKAVIHAHSMALVAFSLAKADDDNTCPDLDPRLPNTRVLLGAYQSCGKVLFAPYALPGSQQLVNECMKAFQKGADIVILQNHGVCCLGKNLHEAYDRFVALEHVARSIVNAIPLHVQPKPLPTNVLKYAFDIDNPSPNNPFPHRIPAMPCPESNSAKRIVSGDEKEMRDRLCTFIHRAYDQNLVTSASGSFSARSVDNGDDNVDFLVTLTGIDCRSLKPEDLCFVSSNTKGITNGKEPNTEAAKLSRSMLCFHPVHAPGDPEAVCPSRASVVHGTIYRIHPEIQFIMITQPPCATSYCITGLPFNAAGIPESHIILHKVNTVPIEAVLQDDGLA